MKDIRQGSIIKSFKWSEPVEISLIEDLGKYVRIVVATTSMLHL